MAFDAVPVQNDQSDHKQGTKSIDNQEKRKKFEKAKILVGKE